MNKYLLATILCCILVHGANAQSKKQIEAAKDTLPYRKFPTLPAFNIRLMDSVTIFNTYNIPEGKPIAIVFFDPDCSHCQAVIKSLIKGMDSLKNIRFYMVTPVHSMTALKKFYDDYHLGDYRNIEITGRDYEFFFGSFYGVKFVPDIALYNEHKKLIRLFEGTTSVKEMYRYTH